jgi:hypothetical protein
LFVADDRSSRLYNNGSASGNNWLRVDLDGVGFNRQAMGGVVEVVAGGVRQRREVFSTFGYNSQGPPRAHFGLGDAEQIDSLSVHWPNGQISELTGFPVGSLNQVLTVPHPMATVIAEDHSQVVPTQFELGSGFPNPFNSQVAIRFAVADKVEVRIEVFNITGQRVRVLVDEELSPRFYRQDWDGRDGGGRPLATGVYIYRMRAGDFVQSRRVLLLK